VIASFLKKVGTDNLFGVGLISEFVLNHAEGVFLIFFIALFVKT
jgi:hypothetical protein